MQYFTQDSSPANIKFQLTSSHQPSCHIAQAYNSAGSLNISACTIDVECVVRIRHPMSFSILESEQVMSGGCAPNQVLQLWKQALPSLRRASESQQRWEGLAHSGFCTSQADYHPSSKCQGKRLIYTCRLVNSHAYPKKTLLRVLLLSFPLTNPRLWWKSSKYAITVFLIAQRQAYTKLFKVCTQSMKCERH